ncbi:MAG TPA: hypothetical protein VF540_07210, partial [Segetibacter sp.]
HLSGKSPSTIATPANAIITYCVIAFIVAVSGGFKQLAIIVSASLLLIFAGVILAAIKFRLTGRANQTGTFKIPGGLTVHIAALVAVALFIIQLELKEIAGLCIFLCVLSVIYFLGKGGRGKGDSASTLPRNIARQ